MPESAAGDSRLESPLDLASGIAAPLLAAISFTLIALTLQLTSSDVRYANTALLLFVAAGLSFITTVQASMWEKRYRRGASSTASKTLQDEHRRWAFLTRNSYHVGILALLAAIAVLLVTPGSIPVIRLSTVGLIAVGFVGEIGWIILSFCRNREAKLRMAEVTGTLAGQDATVGVVPPPLETVPTGASRRISLTIGDDIDEEIVVRIEGNAIHVDAPQSS